MTDLGNNWMQCTTCKSVVRFNNTGICIGCQEGFRTSSPRALCKDEEEPSKEEENYAI